MMDLNRIREIQKTEEGRFAQGVQIDLVGTSTKKGKSGVETTFLEWNYYTVDSRHPKWLDRRCPMYKDEAKLILDHAPFDPNQVYEVVSTKDVNGYWHWTSIQKVSAEQGGEND